MSGNDKWVQRASKIMDAGEAVINLGSDGIYYLWVGGHINISKAVTGKYTGQFTMEIEYL